MRYLGANERIAGLRNLSKDVSLAARNATTIGRLVAAAALARTESRGGHFRTDHPGQAPSQAHRARVTPTPAPAPLLVEAELAA